jgi:predicted GNAT family acetyltransferase
MHNSTNLNQVNFSPTIKQINEIERWLIAENRKTGDGFYCNWMSIKNSFDKQQMITISANNKTVGFATFDIESKNTAVIEIVEIRPSCRKMGFARELTNELFNFFERQFIKVVFLNCSPETSEPIWKKIGFIEFPDPIDNYNSRALSGKPLYKILTDHMQTNTFEFADETIELWNKEPHKTNENTQHTYLWNLEFINGTRKLIKPIIQPGNRYWRMRWRINGKTVKDDSIKYFKNEFNFGNFIIIDELIL